VTSETERPGPIFVVGSMRSGSTLLRLILDSHPAIAIGSETGFMAGLRAAKDIPSWKFGRGWYQRLGWSEREFDERLREFYSGLFERYAAQQGKPRWGEKTPFHTEHIAEMARIFPDAVFVGIVRHPGAVATSLRKFHYGFAEALGYWAATNTTLVRAGSELGARFALCRYEDLVVQGEPVLRELLAWLGEPWDTGVLEHHRVQREKGAPRAVEGSTITQDPIDAARAVRWAEDLGEQERRSLAATRELAGFFGYEPLDPAPRRPLSARSEPPCWLATGDDLLVRRREWSGRVDFQPSRGPVFVDVSPEELAARLAHAESVIAWVRSRRAVRMADAMRTVQHGRSFDDLRQAWSLLRGAQPNGRG